MIENYYRRLGVNDLSLPKRIMRFISDKSKVVRVSQGNITIQCREFWEMSDEEFTAIFGVNFTEEKVK